MPRNPAALAWALLIGSEARVSEQDEREVIAMSSYEQRVTAELEEHGYYSIIEIAAEADARIAELEAQLAECRKIRTDYAMGVDPIEHNDMYLRAEGEIDSLREQLAAAQEREEALRAGFTACIDTLWRYARIAARERGESETSQLMSANEAVGHFRAALNAAKGE